MAREAEASRELVILDSKDLVKPKRTFTSHGNFSDSSPNSKPSLKPELDTYNQ